MNTSKKFILAIDQGTTGTTTLLIDESLKIHAKVTREFPQIYPKPGWVEHNPDDIWRSTEDSISELLSSSDIGG